MAACGSRDEPPSRKASRALKQVASPELGRAERQRLIDALSADYGVHPYGKWRGSFWRLSALVDLGVARGHRGAVRAAMETLDWLASPRRLATIRRRVIDGRVRRCASMEGRSLYCCLRVGVDDPRLDSLAEALIESQWPDGGWNCDRAPGATHSSFHESWGPLLGLAAYGATEAAARAADFFLRHRVVFSERTGEVADHGLLALRYPAYWHYDLLVGLWALAESVSLDDGRVRDALALLEAKRASDGGWHVEGRWWRPPGSKGSNVEAVDWTSTADRLLTARARSVLAAARTLQPVG